MRFFFRAIANVTIFIILPRWGKNFRKSVFRGGEISLDTD